MERAIDIEDAIRTALVNSSITAYCRPLPEYYTLPNILISAVGGNQFTDWNGIDQLDHFAVKIDCRGKTEASSLECLRTAIAILQHSQGSNGISKVTVNSLYSWGKDATRPDLAMCSATLIVSARPETFSIGGKSI